MNPRKKWATIYDDFDIAAEESFIMFGYGSPLDQFTNKSKPPQRLSSEELKMECINRIKRDTKLHPDYLALAEKCIINTGYVHMVRDTGAVKPWDSNCVTLVGDAVFK